MSNELLFFITILANFAMVLVFFRFFKEKGIMAWVAIATVIANIECLKCCNILGLAVTLGNVIYGSMFLCTDILSEMYGRKTAQRAVFLGFFALVASTVMMQLALLFSPNEIDFASPHFEALFGLAPRICASSLVCFLLSNTLDTYLYDFYQKRNLPVWVRNNGSTFISQLIDSTAFTFLAFWGVFPLQGLFELVITTYAMKAIIAALDTPFLYLAKSIHNKYHKE